MIHLVFFNRYFHLLFRDFGGKAQKFQFLFFLRIKSSLFESKTLVQRKSKTFVARIFTYLYHR